MYIIPLSMKPQVKREKITNVMTVPTRPKRVMYPKLLKNFFLLMLNPEANMIGGRQMKKKKVPLN